MTKESKGIFYGHTKLCTASTSLVHTGNMLVYIFMLSMRFVAPWIKFGQVMEYTKRNIIFINHAENGTGRLVPNLVLFFKKVLYEIKGSGLQLSFNIFWLSSTWHRYNKNKLYRTLHYWSRDMLDFDFLEKDLGIASPSCFLYDFSRKMLLMLYSITD